MIVGHLARAGANLGSFERWGCDSTGEKGGSRNFRMVGLIVIVQALATAVQLMATTLPYNT